MIIDGLTPGRIARPQSVDELAEIMRAERGSFAPVGGGTQLEFGNALKSADCALDLRALDRITAYNPADLTVHVETGVTLGRLQQELEAQNQMLPLDPWSGPGATIGGIAAVNTQGPLRAVGTIRDWIIGMRVVHADGRMSKTGGRVVKNVTGYDLAKLYTGSIGTLAVITEISLKVRSRFQKTATAVARFETAGDALETLKAIRQSPLEPVACEFAGPPPTIMLRFGDDERAVDWQAANLPKASWRVTTDDSERVEWESLQEQYRRMGPIVVRVVGTPSVIGEILQTFKPSAWIVHAANGIALLAVAGPEDVRRIRAKFPAVVERAPREVRRSLPSFGVSGADIRIMKDVKQALDPAGRLNPGKHVDGE